jgi:hypothetical protein
LTTPQYWLDANVFIEASNGVLSFEIAPKFWVWLEDQLKSGIVRSSERVYREVLGKDDELAKWAKNRRGDRYWPRPDTAVQTAYSEIAAYVEQAYGRTSPAKVWDFLNKADCWIIAHARAKGGTVVSRELRVDQTSETPKVPNVCSQFNVGCVDTKEMLRVLRLRL